MLENLELRSGIELLACLEELGRRSLRRGRGQLESDAESALPDGWLVGLSTRSSGSHHIMSCQWNLVEVLIDLERTGRWISASFIPNEVTTYQLPNLSSTAGCQNPNSPHVVSLPRVRSPSSSPVRPRPGAGFWTFCGGVLDCGW